MPLQPATLPGMIFDHVSDYLLRPSSRSRTTLVAMLFGARPNSVILFATNATQHGILLPDQVSPAYA